MSFERPLCFSLKVYLRELVVWSEIVLRVNICFEVHLLADLNNYKQNKKNRQ